MFIVNIYSSYLGYQVLAGSKSVRNAERLLSEMDTGSVPDVDSELALMHLEDIIVAKGARLQELVNSVAEVCFSLCHASYVLICALAVVLTDCVLS